MCQQLQCGTLLIYETADMKQLILKTKYYATLCNFPGKQVEPATNELLPGLSLVTALELLAQLLRKALGHYYNCANNSNVALGPRQQLILRQLTDR